jgi:tetratricopeptide (TPR) repeat protein
MKNRRRYTSKRPVPTRRWHIPPPLMHGPEPLEGGAILQDFPGALGVVLWQAYRDAALWGTTHPDLRVEAFANPPAAGYREAVEDVLGSEEDSRLKSGLRQLLDLVADPASAKEEQVARACRQLSDWAFEQGRFNTALAFAQDAALAARSNAAAAYSAALVAARLNDHARAEAWFRRAIGLARRSRDWRVYARSFTGLGNLYVRRGNLPAARRLHTRALRGARRGGMRREQAAALHDLFTVAIETGTTAEAERLARQALEAFGTRNRRIHVLAHDVAYFWMEQGHFARALAVFQAVLPVIDLPGEKVFALGNIVRAAGGVGDAPIAEAARAKLEQMLAQPELSSSAGRVLVEVARGFRSLGQIERAEQIARAAMESAAEHREHKALFAAEALLASIREPAPVSPVPAPTPDRVTTSDPGGDELAADFVRTLQAVAGAASGAAPAFPAPSGSVRSARSRARSDPRPDRRVDVRAFIQVRRRRHRVARRDDEQESQCGSKLPYDLHLHRVVEVVRTPGKDSL